MKRITLSLTLLLCLTLPAQAATVPAQWNYWRLAGTVSDVYLSGNFGAFEVHLTDGNQMRVDCFNNAPALGCDQLDNGDPVIVYGHFQGSLSCRYDGVATDSVANLVYLWNGSFYALITK